MTCWRVERRLSAYLENAVAETERQQLRAHVVSCSGCTAKVQSQRQMRSSLRSLPRLEPPSDLAIRLRVHASKERHTDRTPGSRLRRWRANAKLTLDNLMKPIALPAAGGLCTALLLFGTLVPAFTPSRIMVEDVPLCDLNPSTSPVLRTLAPFGFSSYGDAEVDLKIDGHGRIVNVSILGGTGHEQDALRRSIENNLLFTTFTPATAYGVPIPATLRLSFTSSRIDVKG